MCVNNVHLMVGTAAWLGRPLGRRRWPLKAAATAADGSRTSPCQLPASRRNVAVRHETADVFGGVSWSLNVIELIWEDPQSTQCRYFQS